MNNNAFSKGVRIILLILSLLISGGLILSLLFRAGRLVGFELFSGIKSQGPLLPWMGLFAGLAIITLLMLFIAALGRLLGKKWLGTVAIVLSSMLAVMSLFALIGTTAFYFFKYDNFNLFLQRAMELERKLDLEDQLEQKIYDMLNTAGNEALPSNSEAPITQHPLPSTQNSVPSTQNSVPSTQNSVPPTQNSVPSTQNSVPPTRNILSEAERDALEDTAERAAELRYIGKTLAEAQQIASNNKENIRVVEENGVDLPVTLDYQPGRINLEIMNGRITDLDIEGY